MKERESNIEILRCILMFMVVGLHLVGNGVLDNKTPIRYGNLNFFTGHLLESFFIMAVNCYILISGYFGIKPSFRRLLKFYLPILFYSVTLYCLISVLLKSQFHFKDVLYLMPFIAEKYWFVTSYILLFLISPLLNKILNNITKIQLQIILIIGLCLFVIIPTITPFSFTHDRGFGVVNFTLLYFIGFYLRNFYTDQYSRGFYLLSYMTVCVFLFVINVLSDKCLSYNHGWKNHFYGYDTFLVYCSAIFFFLFIRSFVFSSRIINRISPLVFYVYIIHEHPSVREILYNKILDCPHYNYSNMWILYIFYSLIVIFSTSLFIEFLRKTFLSNIEDKIIDTLNDRYNNLKKQLIILLE